MSKHHAIHNELCCDHLLASGNFNDWVVTTAFYSALHLVNHQIFPFTENNITYNTLNEYCKKRKNGRRFDKHQSTIELVKKHLRSALPSYRFLFDTCMNARYKSYIVADTIAIKSKAELSLIKQVCNKP